MENSLEMTLFTFDPSFLSAAVFPKVSYSMILKEREREFILARRKGELMFVRSCVVKVDLMHLKLAIAHYIS